MIKMITREDSKNRMEYIDFLKFIGLTCIIIAHVNPPEWLFFLRNFDVPLMVVVSAILGQKSFQKQKRKNSHYIEFYMNRIKRLVFPTWIFLTIYFLILLFVGNVYSREYYVYSFLLTRYGIGYVWIILIYVYSALWVPLCDKIAVYKYSKVIIAVIYFVYELIYSLQIAMDSKLFYSTFYTIIPYGILTYLGFNYSRFSKKAKNTIIVVAAVAFLICGVFCWIKYGAFRDVQIAKYPPRIYYLSYGVLVTFLLLRICEKAKLKIYKSRIVLFTSQHSMWLYLWHILALYIYERLSLPGVWIVKFIFAVLFSVIMVVAVNALLDTIDKKKTCCLFHYLRC